MSDIQKLLFEMKNRPQDFAFNAHCFVHTPTGQEIWVCNGLWSYELYKPHAIRFSLLDKIEFHVALKVFRRAQRVAERSWLRSWLCEPTRAPIKMKVTTDLSI
jgi:hypothetical protein